MRYLHTMVRVQSLEGALNFYCGVLGFIELRRRQSETGKFTLVYLAASGDVEEAFENNAPILELTYNWDQEKYSSGRNFGHIAYEVENIYDFCSWLIENGVVLNRPPRDGYMAFFLSPDGISIELLQMGAPLPPSEPWASMPNQGSW
ncbi:VOC family protein [Brucella sp. 458]|uniref:VOC family protein n=1 Tax=Brucella sp. 458 TaxID=2821140 RepID=UPI001ADF6238|nr:VOC family protein [Brucella sp. 458]QTO00011.1 VOC family protein [Brucella sp. 458]